MEFKCLNRLAPPYLCQKFKTRTEVDNCNTRNRDRLHIRPCRTAAGQRAFTFSGQKLWNSLPDEFQSITNLDVFKVLIKNDFLKHKQANINVKSRRFGIIMSPFSRQNEQIMRRFDFYSLYELA